MSQFDETKHNRDTGGKFTHKPHAEADGISLTPTPPSLRLPDDVIGRFEEWEATDADRALVREMFSKAVPETVTLDYIPEDEWLSDDLTSKYLAGDFDTVYDRVRNDHVDARFTAGYDQRAEILMGMGLSETIAYTADFGDLDDEIVYERDDTDPVYDLLTNRDDNLMRYRAVEGGTEGYEPHPLDDVANQDLHENPDTVAQARAEVTEQRLLESGIIAQPLSDTDRAGLAEAFKEGPPEWGSITTGFLFSANPADVALPSNTRCEPNDAVLRTVTTDGDTHLVIVNDHDDPHDGGVTVIHQPVTMPLYKHEHVELDCNPSRQRPVWSDTLRGIKPAAYDSAFDVVFKGD